MQQNSKFPLIFNKISGLTTVAQPEGGLHWVLSQSSQGALIFCTWPIKELNCKTDQMCEYSWTYCGHLFSDPSKQLFISYGLLPTSGQMHFCYLNMNSKPKADSRFWSHRASDSWIVPGESPQRLNTGIDSGQTLFFCNTTLSYLFTWDLQSLIYRDLQLTLGETANSYLVGCLNMK